MTPVFTLESNLEDKTGRYRIYTPDGELAVEHYLTIDQMGLALFGLMELARVLAAARLAAEGGQSEVA